MKNPSSRKYVILALILAAVVGFVALRPEKEQAGPEGSRTENLYAVEGFTHGHGLAVDPQDPNRLYIATHHGLYVLLNEKDLYRVGMREDDYMGFSVHPNASDIVFTSGHPRTGGNLGVQLSEDGGITWKKISNGAGGPVDFHAMAVSPADPDLMYGWYAGDLQRSRDGGRTWEAAAATKVVFVRLAADPKDVNRAYAASPQGLFASDDQGATWKGIGGFTGAFVSTVAVDPQDADRILVFSGRDGLSESRDGGASWTEIEADFEGQTVLFLAFVPQRPEIVYALTEVNVLYKSTDGGKTWNKIR